MPDTVHVSELRAMRPVDDSTAASMAAPDTHAELLEAIVASPITSPTGRRWSRRWRQRPLLPAAALAAIVAILLIATPGLLSGGDSATQPQSAQAAILHGIVAALAPRPGTIVIERLTQRSRSSANAPTTAPPSNSLTTITETSAGGPDLRDFATSSLAPGYEQATAGGSLELYDPVNRTIYATTASALAAQTTTQGPTRMSKGTAVTVGRALLYATGYLPGETESRLAKRMRIHLFQLAGRTTVDGRPALKLVATHGQLVLMSPQTGAYQIVRTLYLTPGSYTPIKQVATIPDGATLVTTWSLYKRLPATPANRRLVSLAARHPHAHVVRGAAGYAAAEARRLESSLAAVERSIESNRAER